MRRVLIGSAYPAQPDHPCGDPNDFGRWGLVGLKPVLIRCVQSAYGIGDLLRWPCMPSPPRTSLWAYLAPGVWHPLRTPLRRLAETTRSYSLQDLRADALAGVSVSVVAVPQSMAYALIAGVPAVYGLYTVIIQCLIGSLLNSQKLLSVGPINTQSLLTAAIVERLIGAGDPASYLSLVVALTFMKGVLQLSMASLRLGQLVKFVSRSVVIGFTAGAGVLIAAGQIPAFMGYAAVRDPSDWPGLIGTLQRAWRGIEAMDLYAILLGTVSLGLLIVSRKISKMIPGPLIAVGLTAAAVAAVGVDRVGFTLVGELPRGLKPPDWPITDLVWPNFDALLTGALALALLGVMEAYSIGRSIADQTGDRISANDEMYSQGLTNVLSSFFWSIPGSGSFSRSALNHQAGARTIYAGVFNALFVLAIFWAFAPAAAYIPMTAIAAILFVVAFGLIDWRYLVRVRKADPADMFVCLGTFMATLTLPLRYAVFIGVLLNIALYLRRASQLRITQMVRTSMGPFSERPIEDRQGRQSVILLQIEGNLFFAQADDLADALRGVSASGISVAVIRLKRTHSIDATCLNAMEAFVDTMQRRGGHVIFCGVSEDIHRRLDHYGLIARVGTENVFPAVYGIFTSTTRALHRARELVGASIDIDSFDDLDENQGWAYHI